MIQEIIALSIVLLAIAYTVFSVVKAFWNKSTNSCGDGCSCGAKIEFGEFLKDKPRSSKLAKPEFKKLGSI